MSNGVIISYGIWESWKNSRILHDEDQWGGKYKTYGEMWKGEGYIIENKPLWWEDRKDKRWKRK